MKPVRTWLYQQLNGDPRGDGRLSAFNWVLVVLIVSAVCCAILATEPSIAEPHSALFAFAEPMFGALFLLEYAGRIWVAPDQAGAESDLRKRLRFVFSPIGILDLVVLIATLSPLLAPNFAVLRVFRLFRLFMLARLSRFTLAFHDLAKAVMARRFELLVTLALAGFLLLFGATALYVVEGDIQPDKFGSIPRALWWSIQSTA